MIRFETIFDNVRQKCDELTSLDQEFRVLNTAKECKSPTDNSKPTNNFSSEYEVDAAAAMSNSWEFHFDSLYPNDEVISETVVCL